MEDAPRTRIFISYSRKDTDFADKLAAALDAQGYDAFIDREDISDAEAWRDRLEALILQADAVAFVMSPDSLASRMCDWETRRTTELGKRLIPLHFRAFEQDPPEQLSRLNYIPIDSEEKFERGVSRLCAACDVDIAWVREHTRLVNHATRWDAGGRNPDRLLRGQELAEAEAWLTRRAPKAPDLPDTLLLFLQVSRAAEDQLLAREQKTQKRTQRLQLGVGGMTVLALVVVVLAYIGLTRMVANASAQRSNTLAQIASAAMQDAQYDRAARFARAALFGADDPLTGFNASGAEGTLREAATYSGALGIIRAHEGGVTSVAFSPDGRQILSAGADGQARLWDAATGEPIASMVLEGQSGFALYSADGSRIVAFAPGSSSVRILDRNGRLVATLPSEGNVRSAELSLDGLRAAATASAGVGLYRAQIWDVEAQRQVFSLAGDEPIVDVSFNADGSRLLTTGAPRLWDGENGRRIADLWLPSEQDPPRERYATFTPDGALALTASDSGAIEVWNARTGRHVRTLRGHDYPVDLVDFDANGARMITTARDWVRVWDMQTWRSIALTATGGAELAVISPRGGRMVSVHDASALFWNITDLDEQAAAVYGDAMLLTRPVYFRGHEGPIRVITYAPDAQRFVTGGEDGALRLWNAQPYVRVGEDQRWISNRVPTTRYELERHACTTVLANGLSRFSARELEWARGFDPSFEDDACRASSPWQRFLQGRPRGATAAPGQS